ncbi:RidA family protein [Streptomyces phaeochromogenes]|uniref:RidA family protein n=1 Tax=Streptomyces phaeochromogenes TaxID=1923 RepID=A0ABZ1H4Y1_STRPH|nr:RidA family protein [Streptomyces phaeochromogenes]MCX5602606.1 RidA family protein [Streptomyces phaeochromogenes]WSD12188.1 RidA family protein [Streptomyces phaeochromogenes]WSJ11010.1 RidA family protein [Streptomyces phaeochromogenes]
MSIQRVNPDTVAPPVQGLYTHAAIGTGSRFIAIAGQIALDSDGNLVGPGDHEAQAEQVFRNFRAALEAAGATPDDLIKNTIHVVGHKPELIGPIFAAGQRAFDGTWPVSASTFLGVQTLGMPEWLIEVDGFAVLR